MLGSHHFPILLLLFFSVLTGCGTEFDGSEEDKQENTAVPFDSNSFCSTKLKPIFAPQAIPNSFLLRFKPLDFSPGRLKVSVLNEQNERIEHSLDELTELNLATQGGEKLLLELFEETSSGNIVKCDSTYTVPKDIVIDSQESFDQYLKNSFKIESESRIFLLAEEPILIGKHQAYLKAKEIVSKDARFLSFQKPAENGQIGKSAESFQIEADKLNGKISIQLTGQEGGSGSPGGKGDLGEKGAQGRSWNHAWFRLGETDVCFVSKVKTKKVEGSPKIPVSQHPLKGRPGSQGKQGKPGGTGLPGGTGGTLVINIEDFDLSQITYNLSGGNGGIGGIGGPGGDGGEGGDPGVLKGWGSKVCKNIGFVVACCPHPPKGERGMQGPTGTSGKQGEMGQSGYLIINGVKIDE